MIWRQHRTLPENITTTLIVIVQGCHVKPSIVRRFRNRHRHWFLTTALSLALEDETGVPWSVEEGIAKLIGERPIKMEVGSDVKAEMASQKGLQPRAVVLRRTQ
jgi:hypothetical protein